MSFFDVAATYRGPTYAVGYGIGRVSTLWHVSRALSEIGCEDETLSRLLHLPSEQVQAARELMGRDDKDATAVLAQAIGKVVVDGYYKILGPEIMDDITDHEMTIAKALIINPAGFGNAGK